jgi:RHS repeat-associated protein
LSKTTTASAPQGAQTVVYFYGLRGHLLAETSGTGTPIRTYAWRNDTPVAQIEHTANGDKILYFDPDHLNTPRAAMDETGKVVWRWESDAFGTTPANEDPDNDGSKTTVNLRFPGQYYDVESGLHYNGHRYYSPLLRIFTQTDRLDLLSQAANPMYAGYSEPTDLQRALNQAYVYVGGNPLSYIDPDGLRKIAGNWIGSDWSGGQSGRIIPTNPAPPKDAVDACAMQHDYCYAAVENSKMQCTANTPRSISDCDAELARCTLAVNSSSLSPAMQMLKPLVSTWAIFHGAAVR